MAFQYADLVADAVSTLAEPFNISGSNDQFSIAIDGGSNQVITLSHGSTQTAANVVSDLSTLTSCTASVVTINGAKFVRIRGTSTLGPSSTILFNAPSNHSNTVLGFTATTYTGGSVVNRTFLADTKQRIIDAVESALNLAGWITISGSGTSTCLVQSAMTPSSQNLRMRLRMKDLGGGSTCATFATENVQASRFSTPATNSGFQFLPESLKEFTIVANKYQAFLFVKGSIRAREFGCWGVPYLPSWLQGNIYECWWGQGNAINDTDTTAFPPSFRTCLSSDGNGGTLGSRQNCVNGAYYENFSSQSAGNQQLLFQSGSQLRSPGFSGSQWHDGSALMYDPLIGWGLTSFSDPCMYRGQLWNAFCSTEAYPMDTIVTSVDSRDWICITHFGQSLQTNGGGPFGSTGKGSLFISIT